MAVKVWLDRKYYYNLTSIYSSASEKGEAVEKLVEEYFKTQGYNVSEIKNDMNQLQRGDLMLTDINKTVEVKTSHSWFDTDKLAFDIYYFKKYNRKTNEIIPYFQSNTESSQGWIYNCNADYLVAFNPISLRLYIIREYQKLKMQVVQAVEMYIEKIGFVDWYFNNHKNPINKYIEGSISADAVKNTFIANLELSESSLRYFNVDYDIIDIEVSKKKFKRK